MRFPVASLASVVVFASSVSSRPATADGAADAVDELKQGYALKQAANCRDAIPHLARSFQLDPKPKALLNRADCEAQLGDLVAAQGHAAEGRRLARARNDAELSSVADGQLAAIEKRLPRLTIRLAPDAPAGCAVSRDGAPVDGTLLDTPVGVNPGAHSIVVVASGYAQGRFDITVAEGASDQIVVQPGSKLRARVAHADAPEPSPSAAAPTGANTRQILGYSALGIGAVGVAVGIATGVAAGSKHTALVNECTGDNCPLTAQGDLDGFRSLRTVSTIAYAVGAAGLVAGTVLWITAPSSRPSGASARMWIGPASMGIGGTF